MTIVVHSGVECDVSSRGGDGGFVCSDGCDLYCGVDRCWDCKMCDVLVVIDWELCWTSIFMSLVSCEGLYA